METVSSGRLGHADSVSLGIAASGIILENLLILFFGRNSFPHLHFPRDPHSILASQFVFFLAAGG